MNALILVNGTVTEPDVIRARVHAEQFDMVLAADGGAGHAEALGLKLDAVIGDMDSFRASESASKTGTAEIVFPEEKDEIDLELAIDYAIEQGVERIVLVGAIGGRMDMTFANILMIANPAFEQIRIEIWHKTETGWLVHPPGTDFPGKPGDRISLIPVGGTASGITLHGMAYPLNDATLKTGVPRGISNIIADFGASVEFATGLLFAVHTSAEKEGR